MSNPIKVKLFESRYSEEVEKEMNKFLEEHKENEIIDIKIAGNYGYITGIIIYLEKEVELNGKVAFLKKRLKTETFTDETRTYSGAGGGGVYTITGSEKRKGDEAILDRARKELANLMKEKNALLYPLAKISQNDPLKTQETATPDITPTYKVS